MLKINKRGSVTVFVCIILSSIVLLVMMFISLSAKSASYSYSSSVLNLAGRSVLSEFDERLKEQYGIIAFLGDATCMENKLEKYSGYSLDNNRYMKVKDIDVSLKEYSLSNVDIFREQVTEDGLALKTYERERGEVKASDKVLRSEYILKGLPSYEIELNTPGIKSLYEKLKEHPDGEGILREGAKAAMANLYIMQKFNSCAFKVSDYETFFDGEIEYILEGCLSDEKNLKEVKKDLIELRTLLNSIFLWSDEIKSAEALAAAEILTPGPEAALTQGVIIESWALAEAENDVKILLRGGMMPIMKTEDTWLIDLETALDPDENIKEGPDTGLSYDEYLNLLLLTLDEQSKYMRMMDIIQINLKGTYSEEFNIKDMYTGFLFSAKVNGRKFTFNETY